MRRFIDGPLARPVLHLLRLGSFVGLAYLLQNLVHQACR